MRKANGPSYMPGAAGLDLWKARREVGLGVGVEQSQCRVLVAHRAADKARREAGP